MGFWSTRSVIRNCESGYLHRLAAFLGDADVDGDPVGGGLADRRRHGSGIIVLLDRQRGGRGGGDRRLGGRDLVDPVGDGTVGGVADLGPHDQYQAPITSAMPANASATRPIVRAGIVGGWISVARPVAGSCSGSVASISKSTWRSARRKKLRLAQLEPHEAA